MCWDRKPSTSRGTRQESRPRRRVFDRQTSEPRPTRPQQQARTRQPANAAA